MKKCCLSLLCLIALSAPQALLAADERGNGGDAVDCRNGNSGTVELLDHYEGRNRYGFKIDMGAPDIAPLAKVELILGRLARLDPERAERYLTQAREFEENALFWSDVELIDIPDSAHVAIPTRCTIKQVAIQKEPLVPEERRYTIAEDLWDAMDSNSKAGLILHEIILRELKDQGHTDSVLTRYFNAAISRPEFATLGIKQYWDLIKAAKVPASKTVLVPYRYGFLRAFVGDLGFHTSGWISSGSLLPATPCELGDGVERQCEGSFELDAEGNLRRVSITSRPGIRIETSVGSIQVYGELNLSSTGKVWRASRIVHKVFDDLWQGQDVQSEGPAVFDFEGRLTELGARWWSDVSRPLFHVLGDCKAQPGKKTSENHPNTSGIDLMISISPDGEAIGIASKAFHNPAGSIKELCMMNPRDGVTKVQSLAPEFGHSVTFDRDYRVASIDIKSIRLQHAGPGYEISIGTCGTVGNGLRVYLHSNGFVRSGCLVGDAMLLPADAPLSGTVFVSGGTEVKFNEQGYWIRKP